MVKTKLESHNLEFAEFGVGLLDLASFVPETFSYNN